MLSMIKEVKKLQGQVVLQEQGMGGPHQCNVHEVGSHQGQTLFIPVENAVFKWQQLSFIPKFTQYWCIEIQNGGHRCGGGLSSLPHASWPDIWEINPFWRQQCFCPEGLRSFFCSLVIGQKKSSLIKAWSRVSSVASTKDKYFRIRKLRLKSHMSLVFSHSSWVGESQSWVWWTQTSVEQNYLTVAQETLLATKEWLHSILWYAPHAEKPTLTLFWMETAE